MNASAPRPSRAMLEGAAGAWRRQGRVLETAFGGASMLPAIEPGQNVAVDCTREPVLGDVVAFRVEEQLVVHRLVRRQGGWMLTWGDANALPDMPVRDEQRVGTLIDIAGPPSSLRRAALLALLAPRGAEADTVARRVALAYGLRNAWRAGPLVFAARCWRRLVRMSGARPRLSA